MHPKSQTLLEVHIFYDKERNEKIRHTSFEIHRIFQHFFRVLL